MRTRRVRLPSRRAVFHDGLIYMTRGYRNSPYLALRPGGRGDVSASHVVWRAPGGGSYAASLVHYDGLLYLTNDVGVLTCADAKTGERVWQTRLDGVFASPVAADGKIYLVSQTGETIVVKAGREPVVLARNDLGERLVASPAISRGDRSSCEATRGCSRLRSASRRGHRHSGSRLSALRDALRIACCRPGRFEVATPPADLIDLLLGARRRCRNGNRQQQTGQGRHQDEGDGLRPRSPQGGKAINP